PLLGNQSLAGLGLPFRGEPLPHREIFSAMHRIAAPRFHSLEKRHAAPPRRPLARTYWKTQSRRRSGRDRGPLLVFRRPASALGKPHSRAGELSSETLRRKNSSLPQSQASPALLVRSRLRLGFSRAKRCEGDDRARCARKNSRR